MGEHFVFAGNPGVGKSTLLNSLVREIKFKAGVSAGGGLTVELQRVKKGQTVYVDTPGLFDAVRIKQAAAEIEKSLKLGGLYKVIFVVQLKAGRVKAEDVTTMVLILNAAPIQQFGIIINDVPKKTAAKIRANEDKFWDNIQVALLSDLPVKTEFVHIVERDEDCVDENDVLMPPSSGLEEFLAKVPAIEISSDKVEQISVTTYEKLQQELGTSLRKVEESEAHREKMKKELLTKIEDEKERRESLMQQMLEREAEERRERERLNERLQEQQRQYEAEQAWQRRQWEEEKRMRQALMESQRQQELQLAREARKRQEHEEELARIRKRQRREEEKNEVQRKTCVLLKQELKQKGLHLSGNKADLVDRVFQARGLK